MSSLQTIHRTALTNFDYRICDQHDSRRWLILSPKSQQAAKMCAYSAHCSHFTTSKAYRNYYRKKSSFKGVQELDLYMLLRFLLEGGTQKGAVHAGARRLFNINYVNGGRYCFTNTWAFQEHSWSYVVDWSEQPHQAAIMVMCVIPSFFAVHNFKGMQELKRKKDCTG